MSAQDLDHELNERRVRLRLRWKEVARRAGMDESNLRRIRQGEIPLTDFAAAGIDQAVEWPAGHAMELYRRGVVRLEATPLLLTAPAGIDDPALLDETERELWRVTELDPEVRMAYINRRRRRIAEQHRDVNEDRELA